MKRLKDTYGLVYASRQKGDVVTIFGTNYKFLEIEMKNYEAAPVITSSHPVACGLSVTAQVQSNGTEQFGSTAMLCLRYNPCNDDVIFCYPDVKVIGRTSDCGIPVVSITSMKKGEINFIIKNVEEKKVVRTGPFKIKVALRCDFRSA